MTRDMKKTISACILLHLLATLKDNVVSYLAYRSLFLLQLLESGTRFHSPEAPLVRNEPALVRREPDTLNMWQVHHHLASPALMCQTFFLNGSLPLTIIPFFSFSYSSQAAFFSSSVSVCSTWFSRSESCSWKETTQCLLAVKISANKGSYREQSTA